MHNELFEICCERDPDPDDQRRRLTKRLEAGANVHGRGAYQRREELDRWHAERPIDRSS